MDASSFLGYVGPSDFHDGSIVSVEHENGAVRVRVRGFSGAIYAVEFEAAQIVRRTRAEGMMIYALSELRGEALSRRFAFANCDEEDDAELEIDATAFHVRLDE